MLHKIMQAFRASTLEKHRIHVQVMRYTSVMQTFLAQMLEDLSVTMMQNAKYKYKDTSRYKDT